MTDATSAPGSDSAAASVEATPAATAPESFSAEDAANYLTELRKPKQQAESAENPATAATNSADEAGKPEPADKQPIGEEEPEAADPEAGRLVCAVLQNAGRGLAGRHGAIEVCHEVGQCC